MKSPAPPVSGEPTAIISSTALDLIRAMAEALATEISGRVVAQLRAQDTGTPGEASNSAAPVYLDEISTSQRYAISRRTLQSWRACGRGPTYRKAGRRVLYRVTDIEKFLERAEQPA